MKKMIKVVLVIGLIIISLLLKNNNIHASELKPAISGVDTILNDISNPFTQDEISLISSIKVIDENNNDYTKDLRLIKDEWGRNKTKLGLYVQTYEVIVNEVSYTYKLNIYNISLEKESKQGSLDVKIEDYKTISSIIEEIEKLEKITIKKYSIINDGYSMNMDKVGSYKITLSVITNSNQEKVLEYLINVTEELEIKEDNNNLFVIVSIAQGVLVIGLITYIIIDKKRRRK